MKLDDIKDKDVRLLVKKLKWVHEKEGPNSTYEFFLARVLEKEILLKRIRMNAGRVHLFAGNKFNHFYLQNMGGYFELRYQTGEYNAKDEGEVMGRYTLQTINKFCEMLEQLIFVKEMSKL